MKKIATDGIVTKYSFLKSLGTAFNDIGEDEEEEFRSETIDLKEIE